MIILNGLEAFLGSLGASLGRSCDFWLLFGGPSGGCTGSGRVQVEREEGAARPLRDPPSLKLLAKANSNYTTAKL